MMNQEIYISTRKRKEIVECRYFARNEEIMYDETFCFKAGNSYGILCEEGEGGGALSLLLSGRAKIIDEKATVYGKKYCSGQTIDEGWFMGKGLPGVHKPVRKEIEMALKKSGNELSLQDVVQEFGLAERRMESKLRYYSGEAWRASAAIGFANKKRIYCFPWLDSIYLQHVLYTAYFYYANFLKKNGCTIIIPSRNRKVLEQMTDEIVELSNPEFDDSFVSSIKEKMKIRGEQYGEQ